MMKHMTGKSNFEDDADQTEIFEESISSLKLDLKKYKFDRSQESLINWQISLIEW